MEELRDYVSESEETRIWTTVYSDMVTNLMLFFLMLYALTRMSAEMRADIIKGMEGKFSGVSEARARAERVVKEFREEDAAERVSALIHKQGIEDYTALTVDEKHIRMTLNMPVLFDSGSAKLGEQARRVLTDVSRIIASVPNKVIIEGHTDDRPVGRGVYDSNWELSVARAAGVIEFFSSERALPSDRFTAAGYGEYKPVESNETPEGRAKNRRIEIVLVRREE